MCHFPNRCSTRRVSVKLQWSFPSPKPHPRDFLQTCQYLSASIGRCGLSTLLGIQCLSARQSRLQSAVTTSTSSLQPCPPDPCPPYPPFLGCPTPVASASCLWPIYREARPILSHVDHAPV
ncbi:unnamed protein product [Protopolystoma xenopodis]|uniref:Uncharacterized protein n=1 Tax=Protopolystoma xenopodis TaxID=117903 RepID=A0A3S5FFP7_9PLAT|nr:unnamed protein product [Protopolystoma xenopodis]